MSYENFSKIFQPEHPNKRLHILILILGLVIILSVIITYQINKAEKIEQVIQIDNTPIGMVKLSNEEIRTKELKVNEIQNQETVKMTSAEIKAKQELLKKLQN